MYAAVSFRLSGVSSHRSTTRCFSWRSRGFVEPARQLRLADQGDRERAPARRLGVGQQPDLFEQLVRHALRLVDDQRQHRGRIGAVSAPSSSRRNWIFDLPASALKPNPAARYSKNSARVSVGFDRCTIVDDAVRRLQRRANERRLAGAGFADQHRDAGPARQPVLQVHQRFAVLCVKHRNRGFGDRSKGRSCSP